MADGDADASWPSLYNIHGKHCGRNAKAEYVGGVRRSARPSMRKNMARQLVGLPGHKIRFTRLSFYRRRRRVPTKPITPRAAKISEEGSGMP